jgi:hypothetical protein
VIAFQHNIHWLDGDASKSGNPVLSVARKETGHLATIGVAFSGLLDPTHAQHLSGISCPSPNPDGLAPISMAY